MRLKNKAISLLLTMIVACSVFFTACANTSSDNGTTTPGGTSATAASTENSSTTVGDTGADKVISLSNIPDYSGDIYIAVNDNVPYFTEDEITAESYEFFSELDSLGRCGVVHASVGKDLMPTEDRGSIGQVKPSGWQTVKYSGLVDGNYLYNRCHLIGFQLTGENANKQNLITGTRAMNVDGMLPFENMVADYVKDTENHVMYRVTPLFEGDNLVAKGVLMEAMSVEDNGEGVLFNVFVYNIQDGIEIDYATGKSSLMEGYTTKGSGEEGTEETTTENSTTGSSDYPVIANKNSQVYHRTTCSRLPKEENRVYFDSEEEANAAGYDNPCGFCNP